MTLDAIVDAIGATPYNRTEYGVLYCADCLDILPKIPDKAVDLILCDPPYGLNFNNGDLAHNREKVFGGDVSRVIARPIVNDGAEDADKLFDAFLEQAARLLDASCCCCCGGGGGPKPPFADWTLKMDKAIGFKQAVVWDKGGLGMGIHYRRNYEFMLVAHKPGKACVWNGGRTTPNIVRINKIIPSADQHPTIKPVALMAHFIHLHSNPDQIVLDPFVGHGPTLVAAKQLGRKYIGIEINEDYCKICVERLRQEELCLDSVKS